MQHAILARGLGHLAPNLLCFGVNFMAIKEQIANYQPNVKRPFWRRKLQGLVNRVSPRVRHLQWQLHLYFHPLQYKPVAVSDHEVPLIINNFNRLDILKEQLKWLEQLDGISSIFITDNKSDYSPLLEFYESLSNHQRIQVVHLGHNSWRKGAAELATQLLRTHRFVIVTDPDLLPYETTPTNLVQRLKELAITYPAYNHVGVSLEIEDLPDHNPLRESIYFHESKFWKVPLQNDDRAFIAPIDTTFALYKQGSIIEQLAPALRTNRPYTLKHVDWYQNPNIRNAEYNHYIRSARIFATWATEMKNRFGL